MVTKITSRHGAKVSEEFRDTINAKLGRVEKFFEKITSCHVILDSEHTDSVVEIVVNIQGQTLSATARSENLGKSVDEALGKIERQLKKINQKIKAHKAVRAEAVEPEAE